MTDIPFKYDETVHDRPPESPMEDIAWATLDTVRLVLRQGAARMALHHLREEAAAEGVEVPPDDVLLRDLDANCPCGRPKHGIDDLAVEMDPIITLGLAGAYQSMVSATREMLQDEAVRVENPGEER